MSRIERDDDPIGEYVFVIAYPIADPKQRTHLALAADWQIRGATLCGETIKREAIDDDRGDDCSTCALIASRR